MTPEEIVLLLQACKASGVSTFKCKGLDVKFGNEVSSTITPSIPMVNNVIPLVPPEEEEEIKHKVEELTSVMKLSDLDLVDRLFPLPQEEEQIAQ